MTQLAIERGLTLIAFEAMNHWTKEGNFSVHVFHKNNELAGYCSVLQALELIGSTGDYGRRLNAAVISFGATARGAVRALSALGISDVTVLTQRPPSAVASPFASVRMLQFTPGEPLAELLAEHDIVVNCILQDTDNPLIFVTNEDLAALPARVAVRRRLLRRGHGLRVGPPDDVRRPDVRGRRRPALLRGRPQPVVPVELGDVGEQRRAARVPARS